MKILTNKSGVEYEIHFWSNFAMRKQIQMYIRISTEKGIVSN